MEGFRAGPQESTRASGDKREASPVVYQHPEGVFGLNPPVQLKDVFWVAIAVTKDPGPRTQDPSLRTQDPGPRTQDPGPRTQDPGPRTQDPGHQTQIPCPWTSVGLYASILLCVGDQLSMGKEERRRLEYFSWFGVCACVCTCVCVCACVCVPCTRGQRNSFSNNKTER